MGGGNVADGVPLVEAEHSGAPNCDTWRSAYRFPGMRLGSDWCRVHDVSEELRTSVFRV